MNLIKKVSIILVCIMVFSFCVPGSVHATVNGGALLDPIMSLVTAIGDAIMSLVQRVVAGIENTFIEISTVEKDQAWYEAAWDWIKDKAGYIVGGIGIIAGIAMAVFSWGSLTAGSVAIIQGSIGLILSLTVAGMGVYNVAYQLISDINEGMLPDTLVLPTYNVTPKEMFSNQIPLLDVDFFNSTDNQTIEYTDDNGDTKTTELYSTAAQLQKTVSKWYQNLRDIAIVALLSILVYIGIRILISSTSNDKAKYKQMLIDWIVALCLLFVMQYIMSFLNILTDKVINIVSSIDTHNYSDDSVSNFDIIETDEGFEMFNITDSTTVYNAYKVFVENWAEETGKNTSEAPMSSYFTYDNGKAVSFMWPAENEMAQVRIKLQLLYNNEQTWESIGYKIIYFVLVIFTCIFLFTYVKRVLYMAFLTIIAPLVAMTYPIDKINDGKAQAFDMWLKEYIFNLLIQPMHLVLYTILIGSAMDLASSNIIYVTCALGFMIPAEKLMRKFFGFTKADTPGMLAGAAGAGMLMAGMNKLLGHGPKSHKDTNSSGKEESSSDNDDSQIKQKKNLDTDAILGGGNNNQYGNDEHGSGDQSYEGQNNGDSYNNNRIILDESQYREVDSDEDNQYRGDNFNENNNELMVPNSDERGNELQIASRIPNNYQPNRRIKSPKGKKTSKLGSAIRRSRTLLCGWNEKEDDK